MSSSTDISSTFDFLPLVAQLVNHIQNDSDGLEAINSVCLPFLALIFSDSYEIKLLIEKIKQCKSHLASVRGINQLNVDSVNQYNTLSKILESKL